MSKQSEAQEEESLKDKSLNNKSLKKESPEYPAGPASGDPVMKPAGESFKKAAEKPSEASIGGPLEDQPRRSSGETVMVADIGNSNIVIGYFGGDELVFTMRIPTHSDFTTDRLYSMITEEMESRQLGRPDGVIIESVVPRVSGLLANALYRIAGREPVMVRPDFETGLHTKGYDEEHLGMDRLVDAAAAAFFYGAPVVVFDVGTCTTMSVVDENSCFLGGTIAPGVKLSLDALADHAAQLPHVAVCPPEALIGKDTPSCMLSGAVIGAASMIDGFTERLAEQLNKEDLTVVVTGGLGQFVIPWCRKETIYDPALLLKGLLLLYRRNR